MFTKQTRPEFRGKPDSSAGWVYKVDDKQVVQIEFHPDETDFEPHRNRRTGEYTIWWRIQRGIVPLSDIKELERKIVMGRYQGGSCPDGSCAIKIEPRLVVATYFWGEVVGRRAEDKTLIDFLTFGRDAELDEYDCGLKGVHDKFVVEQADHVSWVSRDVKSTSGTVDFTIQADLKPIDDDTNQELVFQFDIPHFPIDVLLDAFQKTSMIPMDDELAAQIMAEAKSDVEAFYNRPLEPV